MSDLPPDPNAGSSLVSGGALDNTTLTDISLPSPSIQTNFSSTDTSLPTNLQPSSDNAAVSPNAPTTNTQQAIDIQVEPSNRGDFIRSNCLDDYMNVTYGVSLAMVSFDTVKQINTEMESDPHGLSPDQYIVFASTGDTKTNIDTTVDYYNIINFNFTSFVGHLPQNPLTAAIWDGKMHIFEPYGFQLREDIERMRLELGYDPVEPWNFVYRLEIWFSGFDGQTGQWVQNIPIPVDSSRSLPSVVYYLTITTIDARVTPQGTEYQLSFQMYSHKTLRSDSLIFRMEATQAGGNTNSSAAGGTNAAQNTTVKFGSGNGVPKFKDFIQNLITALKQQVLFDTGNWLEIIYKVYGPEWLFDAEFDKDGKIEIKHGAVSPDSNSGTYTYASQDIDIFTFINSVMENLPLVRKLMLQPQDPGFLKPTVTWNVRSNIKYSTTSYKPKINGYSGYTFEYFIEPVLSFRSRTTEVEQRNDRTTYDNQLQRAQAMVNYGMLLRVYDFLFTASNSEVIEFNFRFKNFYQEAYPSTGSDTNRRHSLDGDNPNYQKESEDLKKQQTQQEQASGGPSITFSTVTNVSLSDTLGIAVSPQSSTDQLPPAAKHGGLLRGPDLPAIQNDQRAGAQPDLPLFRRAKDQYFRYDMLSADMTVRFDPIWLMNPYMVGGDFTPRFADAVSPDNAFLYINTDRVVFINALRPNQADFMNPSRTGGGDSTTPFLGGFYQVITVVNIFDSGKFMQKLNLFKYPHLNGFTSLTGDPSLAQNASGASASQPQAINPTSDAPDPNAGGTLG